MPINPQHFGSLTFLDYSREKSSMTFFFPAVTALNIADFLSDFGDLRTATEALSIGTLAQDQWTGDRTVYSKTPPADLNAQRERKWLVTYEDTSTFAEYQVEIPVAKTAGLLVANTDLGDLSAADWVTWIAAFETLARSPEGNTVNVLRAQLVGRNI